MLLSCRDSKQKHTSTSPLPLFIELDGSSSMFPIAQDIVSEFLERHPETRISLSLSGTSNGFMKFCAGKLEINNASRPMSADEVDQCNRNGVKYIELKVAYDAIVIAVNPANSWCDSLTTAELGKIWSSPDKQKWSDINPLWPKTDIHFHSPGKLSGTSDIFYHVLNIEDTKRPQKITTSEDHNDVVMNISKDSLAFGFFSLPYLSSNWSFVKPLAIDDQTDTNGKGPTLPTTEAIERNQYAPFQRALYLYVNQRSFESPTHYEFIRFFLERAGTVGKTLGYGALSPMEVQQELRKIDALKPASEEDL